MNTPMKVVKASSILLLRHWKRLMNRKGARMAIIADAQIGMICVRRGYARWG